MALAIDRPTSDDPLVSTLTANWVIFLARGVAALFFGSSMYLWPGPTLPTLVMLFGAYALADGILTLGAAFRGIVHSGFGGLLFDAVIRIAAGGVALIQPELGAVQLVQLIAGMAIASGAMQITSAIAARKSMGGVWPLFAAGAISIAFGTALLLRSEFGALALLFLIGLYALCYGAAMIALGVRAGMLAGDIRGL